jgi:hypothetical protein
MMTAIEDAFRGTAASIENLVRAIVRDELRRHLGPEADHLINVKTAPMSARKLRSLIRSGELRGFKHGKDTFISATEFRSFIEGHPAPVPKPLSVPEPPPDTEQDSMDDLMVTVNLVPTDPAERRAFETRLAQRRAEGGPRAAALRAAELERDRDAEKAKQSAERAARRAAKKGRPRT